MAVGVLLAAAAPRAVLADEYTDKVNKLASDPSVGEKARSDLVLLPLLAKLQPPPAVLRSQERAALLADKGPGWAECAAWAQAPSQKAVLEALDTVTKEQDRKKAFIFGQPYGEAGVSVDLIKDNMFTDLGDPPLLAAAQIKYMPAMENTGILVQVEATRLMAAGDGKAAMKTLADWIYFTREMADRPMLQEKKWAMNSMRIGLERIRDLVYTDMLADKHVLVYEAMDKENERLSDGTARKRGFLQLDKIAFPEGDFIAREQLIKMIMGPDGKPDPATFAPLMARASSSTRPLKLFSAAAFWEQARAAHAGERESTQMLKGIHDDWAARWSRSAFDRVSGTASDYRKRVQTSNRFPALGEAFAEIDSLFSLRQQLKTELAGTRMSVGAYGFYLRNKTLPTGLAACVPTFFNPIDKDPYSPPPRNADISYFVPMRDTPKDQSGAPKPVTITLWPPPPNPEFKREFDDHVFVVYSVGPDGLTDAGLVATQTRVGVRGDYLLFPPTISLYRQRLLEKGELK
jgi:hypothetical protein